MRLSTGDADDAWLLLKTQIDGLPHFIAVMPSVPPKEERAAYSVSVTVTVAYEPDENGLPLYEDDLEALNGIEQDLRCWDPDEAIFRNAIRSTGGGERKWVLYATSAKAFEALIPENDFMAVATTLDPDWSEVASVLAGVRR